MGLTGFNRARRLILQKNKATVSPLPEKKEEETVANPVETSEPTVEDKPHLVGKKKGVANGYQD